MTRYPKLVLVLISAAVLASNYATSTPSPQAVVVGKAPWSLRYFTLRGAAVDFMLRYPEALADSVGGRAIVMKNGTYQRLSDMATRFSVRFAGDEFGDAGSPFVGTDSDAGSAIVPSKSFLGKPFFAGDSHNGAGFYPSPQVSDRDLKQILAANSQWRLALEGFAAKDGFGRAVFWRSADTKSLLPAPKDSAADAQLIKLMNYAAGGSLPFGFLLQYHEVQIGGCGDEAELSDGALPRYVNVRVAVFENNSGKTLNVSGFRGAANEKTNLRLSSADDRSLAGAEKALPWRSTYQVGNGERLVVPLRIAFSYSDYEFASPDADLIDLLGKKSDSREAKSFLGEFKRKKKGLEFLVRLDDGERTKKTAIKYSSLATLAARPWRDPATKQDFISGPSYKLTTLKVNAAGSPTPRVKSLSINYTTAEGFGSCPFVSVWDEHKALWLDKGRVLVGRVGPESERGEVYDLPTAPTLIAVREKEAEETHLSALYIEIVGLNRVSYTIKPAEAIGSTAMVIREGEERIFRFQVPARLMGRPAKLHVAGYYVRVPRIRVFQR